MQDLSILNRDDSTSVILGPKLTLKEFQCTCDHSECSRTLINFKSIRSFDKTRFDFGYPVRITSGFRCQMHNKDVGGLKGSFHLIGSALDLQPVYGDLQTLDRLQMYALRYFDIVVRYETFIHCHNNNI
jgi:hypothetical protein